MINPVDCLSVKTILLSLVNNLPSQRSPNSLSQYTAEEQQGRSRTLSFKDETWITQQLAIICAYSDDPGHVLAVCVEEGRGGGEEGLKILFAANTGRHEGLREGLEGIGRVLGDEARNVNRSTNRESLFEAVVALNRMRILTRIRSRHSTSRRASGKGSLLKRLGTATDLLRKSSISKPRLQSLETDVDGLQKLFNSLEDVDSLVAQPSRFDAYLRDLVRGIHSFFQRYEEDLKLIPCDPRVDNWDKSTTESLIDRLGKVGQYFRACKELLKAARRYRRLFSDIAVGFVDLQQCRRRVSGNAPAAVSDTDIDGVIDASCSGRMIPIDTRKRIKARFRETSKLRLHAEIQLVLYYEQNTGLIRPRVICSSKSACYLCNLFLSFHGRYYTPSNHGRLYDTWKWPAPIQPPGHDGVTVDLQHLLPEFTDAIDRKLRDCLDSPRVKKGEDRPESMIDLRAAMTPSVRSCVSQEDHSLRSEATYRQELGQVIESNEHVDEAEVPYGSLGTGMTTVSLPQASRQEYCDSQRRTLHLLEGEVARYAFDMENSFLQVHIPGLRVDLEYDTSSFSHPQSSWQASQQTPGENPFRMEVEYLTSSKDYSPAQVVDLDGISSVEKSAPEGILFSNEGLILKKRSILMRLRAGLA